jgi:acetyltransferase
MPAHVVASDQPDAPSPHRESLDVFFEPATVAVFGASETAGSVGRTIMRNLICHPFGGTIFPISPRWGSALGIKAYPRLADVPVPVELGILASPAATVPGILDECAAAGVRGAIILSDAFRGGHPSRAALERQIQHLARRGVMRVLGPNSMGVACSRSGFNATFAQAMIPPGSVGFISQSGSLLTALASGGLAKKVGCSAFISVGSMIDIGWVDCIEYLGADPATKQIGIFLESMSGAAAFFEAIRKVALDKPVIVVRAGRTAEAAKAADWHSGSLPCRDDFLDEAFRRSGALRVDSIADLFRMAELMATQPTPSGRRLTILSNAGGPAVVATDALIAGGGELAQLAPETEAALDRLLPAHGNHLNPIDVGDDADSELVARTAEVVVCDPNSDGLLVILTPQVNIDPTRTAEALVPIARACGKPVLASWLWGAACPSSLAVLGEASIPTFSCPNAAVRAFGYLCRHGSNLRDLSEVATFVGGTEEPPPHELGRKTVLAARQSGRTVLTEPECRLLLAAYSLPTVESRTAADEAAAVDTAEAMGYPVLLTLQTESTEPYPISVQLYALDQAAVRRAYRTLQLVAREHGGPDSFRGVRVQPAPRPGDCHITLASTLDSQLGPVIQLSAAGTGEGVVRLRSFALPPLSVPHVRKLAKQACLFTADGAASWSEWTDLNVLEQLLSRFSRLVVGEPWLKEIHLDPLIASPNRLTLVEARALLHSPEVPEESLPRPLFISPHRAQELQELTTV